MYPSIIIYYCFNKFLKKKSRKKEHRISTKKEHPVSFMDTKLGFLRGGFSYREKNQRLNSKRYLHSFADICYTNLLVKKSVYKISNFFFMNNL